MRKISFMKDKHISVGKIFGIPIYLDYSWFLILALLTWMLAQSYFPHEFKNWTEFSYWTVGFITSILFFISILLHEFGHSIIAIKYKSESKKDNAFRIRRSCRNFKRTSEIIGGILDCDCRSYFQLHISSCILFISKSICTESISCGFISLPCFNKFYSGSL